MSRIGSQAIRIADHRIASVLKRLGIGVVLAEYGPTAVSFLPACRSAGVRLVVHFHGADLSRSDILETYRSGYKTLFAEAAAMIVVSAAMKRRLEEMAGPSERIFLIHYGVEGDFFRAVNAAANPPTFVAVGRFVDKKAPHLTLLAFRQAVEECPESSLVMVGDGPLLPACQELARALGLEGRVLFTGILEPARVVELFGRARAFVQHSVTAPSGDSEGTPVAVLEAGASALPVIATRHAGIPDVVIDGQTGLLTDEFDLSGMAQHMIRLAKDPDLAGRLGQCARQRVTAHFSSEKAIGQLRDALAWAAGKTP
jgi:glycosyltransferase involved in cell wall biosynthesis